MKPIVLWGGTGQALVLSEIFAGAGYRLVALLDRDSELRTPFTNVPTFAGPDAADRWSRERPDGDVWFMVAIGGSAGRARLAIAADLVARGLHPATLVHPTAYVSPSATLGPGTVALAQSAVSAHVHLGAQCIVNTSASVDHNCRLGDGVHIGPGATLAGCVELGPCAFVGVGASVAPRVRIGADAIVGAGAVVVRDVPGGSIAFGNPARVQRRILEP